MASGFSGSIFFQFNPGDFFQFNPGDMSGSQKETSTHRQMFCYFFLFVPSFVLFQFISRYFFDKMLWVVIDAPGLTYYGTHILLPVTVPIHTAHCAQYTANDTLYTIHVHTTHYTYTLNTAHCTMHTAHCTVNTAHCILQTAHCILHTAL